MTSRKSMTRAGRYHGKMYVLTEPIVQGSGRLYIDDTVWRIAGPDCPGGHPNRHFRLRWRTASGDAAGYLELKICATSNHCLENVVVGCYVRPIDIGRTTGHLRPSLTDAHVSDFAPKSTNQENGRVKLVDPTYVHTRM